MNLEDYAVTDSTRETYRHQLDVFRRWLNGREFDSLEPSAQDAICAEYVHARYEDGIAPSTIRQFAFAVAYYAKQAGRPSPIGPKSSNSIKGASRKGRSRGTGQRRGINRFTLERMAKAAVDGSTKGYRDAALLRVGYDVLARIGELAALNVDDVQDDTLIIRASKTDQTGKGATAFLGPATVEAVDEWLERRGYEPGPLFCPVNKHGWCSARSISTEAVRQIIRRRAAAVGETDRISGHSLRVGAAQELARMGATLAELMTAGRWKSPVTAARYIAKVEASRGAVARLFYGK